MANILLTTRVPSPAMRVLEQAGNVTLIDEASVPLVERMRPCHALMCLLTEQVDAAVLDAAGPELAIVANIAVGFDNIDMAAAEARGVVVTNTPGVLTESVAQFTWALILGITRRLGEGERLVRSEAWTGWALDLLPGMQLDGKRLGIVGAGRIGRAVAAKAGAFGMNVVFATSARQASTIDDHPVVSLDELLVSSDVVSIHAPLTTATTHLIDKRTLTRMRRSAYLINTGRGPIVDEAALAWALGERLIAGAALDVYEDEPRVYPALRDLDNVLFAPHIASATRATGR